MCNKGFTLIELVVVILLLSILSVIALPKFLNLQEDTNLSVMSAIMASMKAAISSADKLIAVKIRLNPENINANRNRFFLDNGETILIRGKLPDGRWDNTFIHLLDFSDIAQVSSNSCDDESLKWCVRQRGANWFLNRGYSTLGTGRGFAIFPLGKDVNQNRCYVYFLNQNDSAEPSSVQPSIIGSDFSECNT